MTETTILSDNGINWIHYIPVEINHDNQTIQFLGAWYRRHKDDMAKHPLSQYDLEFQSDSEGRSGINIEKFRLTGIKESYQRTHLTIRKKGVTGTKRYHIIPLQEK